MTPDARAARLSRLPYEEYLRTRHWRELRLRALGKWGGLCEECGSSTATEVHHRTYERLGREELRDLEPLCPECHRSTHGRREMPVPQRRPHNSAPPIASSSRAALRAGRRDRATGALRRERHAGRDIAQKADDRTT